MVFHLRRSYRCANFRSPPTHLSQATPISDMICRERPPPCHHSNGTRAGAPAQFRGATMTEQTMRAARLWQIEGLLRRRPQGYSSGELARELGCSTRTIQRDLLVLQIELGAPVEDAPHRRYRIDPAAMPLSPVRFTLHEARAMYLAGRLFLRYAEGRGKSALFTPSRRMERAPCLRRICRRGSASRSGRPCTDPDRPRGSPS